MRLFCSIFIIILSIIQLLSCNSGAINNSHIENVIINDSIPIIIRNKLIMNKINVVSIIPNQGCGGCIDMEMQKLIDNPKSLDSQLVVFTNIQSIKKLKFIMGDLLSNSNIIIDSLNTIENTTLNPGIYPRLYNVDIKGFLILRSD